jgi:two-component system chemotaxis response regulator CheB
MTKESANGHDVIVIGASAGGVEALRTLVSGLSADLPAAVFVATHLAAEGPGLLPHILARSSPLPVQEASDGAHVERGRVYVARPDHHLMIEDSRMRVIYGPKENRARPAIDPLFRSAALAYGPRVIGVVLTGGLNDGAAGLAAIKKRGGLAVVQDPADALYPSMPRHAIAAVAPDEVVPVAQIPGVLVRMASERAVEAAPASEELRVEVAMGAGKPEDIEKLGDQSPYSCPECGGVLIQVDDPLLLRYRCRVGHAYTAEALAVDQDNHIEDSLWAALRALEESANLKKRMADRLRPGQAAKMVRDLDAGAQEAQKHAGSLRKLLVSLGKSAEE